MPKTVHLFALLQRYQLIMSRDGFTSAVPLIDFSPLVDNCYLVFKIPLNHDILHEMFFHFESFSVIFMQKNLRHFAPEVVFSYSLKSYRRISIHFTGKLLIREQLPW